MKNDDSEAGAALIEYSVVLALLALTAVVSVSIAGRNINSQLRTFNTQAFQRTGLPGGSGASVGGNLSTTTASGISGQYSSGQ